MNIYLLEGKTYIVDNLYINNTDVVAASPIWLVGPSDPSAVNLLTYNRFHGTLPESSILGYNHTFFANNVLNTSFLITLSENIIFANNSFGKNKFILIESPNIGNYLGDFDGTVVSVVTTKNMNISYVDPATVAPNPPLVSLGKYLDLSNSTTAPPYEYQANLTFYYDEAELPSDVPESTLAIYKYNESTAFSLKILFSTIPVLLLGIFFKDEVENLFGGRVGLVGSMLIITSILLLFANYAKNFRKDISYGKAFIIGIAQALAVMPGISRSGATISTSLMLGVDREKATRFSFLMVLIPIIGAMLLDVLNMIEEPELSRGISFPVLFSGFIAAFITGIIACKWMISIVKRGKLLYFAIYCLIVGLTAIGFSVFYVN